MPDPIQAPAALRDVYTVTRLNLAVRAVLEEEFPAVWVEGEISNLARPRSGHLYFSLKDENCQVRCAMFRNRNRTLDFEPADGAQVLAHGRLGLYAERGEYQLVVHYLEEAGAGALRRAFEVLKSRLAAEGLFDETLKRPLPAFPRHVAVVTSPTGAAIRDVLSVLARRFPAVPVTVCPVPVQGIGAGAAIAAMIARAGAETGCDVLILCRGGGSLEDLWAFNEEVVARAIRACPVPVVTGIGHEVDFTIADLAADRRAPTPSAAAELVTPDGAELRAVLLALESRLARAAARRLRTSRDRLGGVIRRLRHPRRRLQDLSQGLDHLGLRLARALRVGLEGRRARLATADARFSRHAPEARLEALRRRCRELDRRLQASLRMGFDARRARLAATRRALEAVGPTGTLARGYAIVLRAEDGAVVRDAGAVEPGGRVDARLARGTLHCRVDSREE